MTTPDEGVRPLGSPTPADKAKAAIWESAIEIEAEIWTRLSPEQQRMVRVRIEWAFHIEGDAS